MEHLHHFGLRQDPFQNEPDLRFYFDGVSHIETRRRIERGLRQQKGLCVLTGEGGTGKSLLARRLLEGLEEEVFDAQMMLMMPGATDASSVLTRYARMVGVEEVDGDRPTLLGQIYEQLAMVREEGRHSVLILDDAHLLSKDALAEIGGLLNLEYEDRRLVSLLLVGLPQLEVTLSHEPSLGQRIDVRARLEPLDYQNAADYLMHRLTCAGGQAEILPDEALSALFKFGRGRPRLLNTLTDNALFEAYLADRTHMISRDVERAAADLGIGSSPGSTYTDGANPNHGGGSMMSGAPGTTMELNDVAEPEFEVSSFDTGAADLSAGMETMPAPAGPEPASGVAPDELHDMMETNPTSVLSMDAGEEFDADPVDDSQGLEMDLMGENADPGSSGFDSSPSLSTGGFDGNASLDTDELSGDAGISMGDLGEVAEEPVDDLESAVEAMMSESSGGDEPSPFATVLEEVEEESESVQLALEGDSSPLGSDDVGDELDDLFVELIED